MLGVEVEGGACEEMLAGWSRDVVLSSDLRVLSDAGWPRSSSMVKPPSSSAVQQQETLQLWLDEFILVRSGVQPHVHPGLSRPSVSKIDDVAAAATLVVSSRYQDQCDQHLRPAQSFG